MCERWSLCIIWRLFTTRHPPLPVHTSHPLQRVRRSGLQRCCGRARLAAASRRRRSYRIPLGPTLCSTAERPVYAERQQSGQFMQSDRAAERAYRSCRHHHACLPGIPQTRTHPTPVLVQRITHAHTSEAAGALTECGLATAQWFRGMLGVGSARESNESNAGMWVRGWWGDAIGTTLRVLLGRVYNVVSRGRASSCTLASRLCSVDRQQACV
jgi:hypothetical protein